MNYVDRTWRLIIDRARRGSLNMAIDEAIMLTRKADGVPSTLRFYTWDKYYVSVGYFQQLPQDIISLCAQQGISLVRRPTGGGCVFHDQEITLSVVFSRKEIRHSFPLVEYYRIMSECIQTALGNLGLSSQLYEGVTVASSSYFCFNQPAKYDVIVDNKKVFGSAQYRCQQVILQQGTLRLKKGSQQTFGAQAGSLEELLPEMKKDRSELYYILSRAFEQTLGIRFLKSRLTAEELRLAKELESRKYSWSEELVDVGSRNEQTFTA